MYTFLTICAGLFLLSGVIFKRKIKQNQISVYFIVIVGSLIGTTIINGIYGLNVPYSKVFHKEKILNNKYSNIVIYKGDTSRTELPFKHVYKLDSNNKVIKNYIICEKLDGAFYTDNLDKIKFTIFDDSVSRLKIYKTRRVIDNNWVTSFGLPSKSRTYEVLIPDTKANNNLLDNINVQFYKNEKI